MRVFNKIGSKDRLFEMFEKVSGVKLNESTDQDKYENVVFMQGDEADEALEILNNKGEDAALEYLKQWHDYGNHEGSNELGAGTSDDTFEKDGYIMAYNQPLGYIGLQYDTQANESFDSPEEKDKKYLDKSTDEVQPHKYDDGYDYPAIDDLKVDSPLLKKVTEHDEIEGGQADDIEPKEFDEEKILKGISVEMEHTNNPRIALEIAMDHLAENPDYYEELEDAGLVDDHIMDIEPMNVGESFDDFDTPRGTEGEVGERDYEEQKNMLQGDYASESMRMKKFIQSNDYQGLKDFIDTIDEIPFVPFSFGGGQPDGATIHDLVKTGTFKKKINYDQDEIIYLNDSGKDAVYVDPDENYEVIERVKHLDDIRDI
jgi:hypothetical protein